MHDYQPVDLGPLCNAGITIYKSEQAPPTGQQTFHGLPFLIGADVQPGRFHNVD